jgi:hypothetical protein
MSTNLNELERQVFKSGPSSDLRTGPLTTDLEGGPALWFPKTVAMVMQSYPENTIGQLRSYL